MGQRVGSAMAFRVRLPVVARQPLAGHVAKRSLGRRHAAGPLTTAKVPNKCNDGGAKTHACADEMHEINHPNGGERRATEHAAQAEETEGGENQDDSKRFAV